MRWPHGVALACAVAVLTGCHRSWPSTGPDPIPALSSVLAFTNQIVRDEPWSIHVARVLRNSAEIEFLSVHASNSALGLTPLSQQIASVPPGVGTPLAGVNGDFYQRERKYAGDARGLQVVNGEVISAPSGTSTVWTDANGEPHSGTIQSEFTVTWPDGFAMRIGLNEERFATNAVLFTPAVGLSTHSTNGVELVLERDGGEWLPLRLSQNISARVRAVRERPNTAMSNDLMVLSIGPAAWKKAPPIAAGAVVRISTATNPDLRGIRNAISGGPILARNGKALKVDPTGLFPKKSYSARSMFEQHPRSAIGWNDQFVYFVEVDGRQRTSAGMTLDELRDYMMWMGCKEVVNMDGGGSSTLWCNGTVVNHPCDLDKKRHVMERPIANGFIAVRKSLQAAQR